MVKKRKIIVSVLLSVGVGAVNGLLGGGGGMLCVPLLVYGSGLAQKKAHATAIFVMLLASVSSGIVYFAKVDNKPLNLVCLAAGTLIGGIIGAFLLKKINTKIIKIIFALLMLVAGISLVVRI